MRTSHIRPTVLFAAYASISAPAYAYLDPATGSIIVQTLIGAIATWFMYSKMFVGKAKSFLSRLTKGQASDTSE